MKSLAERYDAIEKRRGEIEKMGLQKQPTAVHIQTVKVLKDLLTLGRQFSTGSVPAPLRAMMRTLDKMEPVLIEELAAVPPEQIQVFLKDLADRLTSILEVPADGSGPAQSPSA